ncbi:hypothetical protein BO94DRAFT_226842 [Aspergillus sclerotioniger CBS 115572]|uniref:Uncharacterized protein n=1 Tax=Aspergillus sclerotioniger CBS 115572 TaxID=1450535 RepID=A0A317XCV7_9EURO|nr:hypothetical protein BO94DRAFT_226842 [Aspergillus sclerotioniger CBS 115572]PWY95417.1 hypothetical protein BO94DRAFT_226842 [Aspergillus sclerotioniger CBS 115572]
MTTRSLNVDFTSWTGKHLEVTEGDTLVYSADLNLRKPHMVFQATGSARLPATVSFHAFTRAIDIDINGRQIPFKPRGTFEYEVPFDSPTVGSVFTWRNPHSMKPWDLECRDEQGTVVARFIPSTSWSRTKAGRLELDGLLGSGPIIDEVVVTGLALAYYIITQTLA